jgi:hypothetical protein
LDEKLYLGMKKELDENNSSEKRIGGKIVPEKTLDGK